MTKVFSIEHLRALLLVVLGGFPLFGVAMWGLLRLTLGDDGEPGVVTLVNWLVPGTILALMVLTLGITALVMNPGRYLRDYARLADGRAWAIWPYSREEWAAAKQVEAARLRRSLIGLYVTIGLAVLLALIGLAAGDIALAGVGGVLFVLAAVMLVIAYLSSVSLRLADDDSGEVRIGAHGVLRKPGRYTALAAGGTLHAVEVTGAPARLVFTSAVRGRYGVQHHKTVDLLVPPGRQDEARALAERFDAEVIHGWKHDMD
ncbi:hypothetical protein ACQP00_28305 [Dactylosporangium sp. CS-047395]|uniref:hypothetical protein n=1 Tax=Dactylosporangium sp. CS-047395 TaxID=3239936 RepID=UPI003D8D0BFD